MQRPVDRLQRLQKALAHAGLGSRSACEQLIRDGRVAVDGLLVTDLGHQVSPTSAVITVDGRTVTAPARTYLALHKPPGVVATMKDPQGRPSLSDLLSHEVPGLFHIGRIDAESAGLILLTNDGDLGHVLTAPDVVLPHAFIASLHGEMTPEVTAQLVQSRSRHSPAPHVLRLRVIATGAGQSVAEVVLEGGQTAALRRLLSSVGHPVDHLVHTGVGPVKLAHLPVGATRPLTEEELAGLWRAAGS